MSARVVVVGAGRAGLSAAEALLAADASGGAIGEVLLVGDEPWAPYDRPPVSKQALLDGLGAESLALPRVGDPRLVLHSGVGVARADVEAREVHLADGRVLAFDGLVAATGLRPRRLGLPGSDRGGHVLRSIDDAGALRRALAPGVRLLVVGAGFAGCEVASAARAMGCEVTCVSDEREPMLGPLGAGLGAVMRRRHEAAGVAFRLGRAVRAYDGDDRVRAVELDDGERLEADVVLEAVGSVPAVGWLEGQGFDLADGVLADASMRVLRGGVALDHVVVAGDLARYPNPRFDGVPRRVEHWSNAADTGRTAGASLAAHLAGEPLREPPDVLPQFWSDQAGVTLQAFGLPQLADPDGARALEGSLDAAAEGSGGVLVGYHRGDDLVGVATIGLVRAAAALRARIGRGRATG